MQTNKSALQLLLDHRKSLIAKGAYKARNTGPAAVPGPAHLIVTKLLPLKRLK
jgi:hypothetical protein